MNKILLLLAILALSATKSNSSPVVKPIECDKTVEEFKRAFDEIEHYLVENVHEDDPEVNLEAAKRWLQTKFESDSKSRLSDALKLFTSIELVSGRGDCNVKSLEIIMRNDEATNGQALDPSNVGKKMRRIERVIDFYTDKHEESCLPKVTKSRNGELAYHNPPVYPNNNHPNYQWRPQNFQPTYVPAYPPAYVPAYPPAHAPAYPPAHVQQFPPHSVHQPVVFPPAYPMNQRPNPRTDEPSSIGCSANLVEQLKNFGMKLVKNRLAKKKKKKRQGYGYGGGRGGGHGGEREEAEAGEEEEEEEEGGGFADLIGGAIADQLGDLAPQPVQDFANEYGGYFTDPVGTIEGDILDAVFEDE